MLRHLAPVIMMKLVYDYAIADPATEADTDDDSSTEDAMESGIGNVMRKLLEGYASFSYNKSFIDMLNKKDLLECITPEKKRTYYGNFMFRLALNSESHLEEQTYSFHNMAKLFPKDEKVKTAKCLLLLLYYLNKPHLASYLGKDAIQKVESWQDEEDEWIKNDTKKN